MSETEAVNDEATFGIRLDCETEQVELPSNDMYRRFESGERTFTLTITKKGEPVLTLRGHRMQIDGEGVAAVDEMLVRANSDGALADSILRKGATGDGWGTGCILPDIGVIDIRINDLTPEETAYLERLRAESDQ